MTVPSKVLLWPRPLCLLDALGNILAVPGFILAEASVSSVWGCCWYHHWFIHLLSKQPGYVIEKLNKINLLSCKELQTLAKEFDFFFFEATTETNGPRASVEVRRPWIWILSFSITPSLSSFPPFCFALFYQKTHEVMVTWKLFDSWRRNSANFWVSTPNQCAQPMGCSLGQCGSPQWLFSSFPLLSKHPQY